MKDNNTDVSNESLEDYIKSLTDVIFYDNDIDNDRKDFYELGAKGGATWQKEKDKAIQEDNGLLKIELDNTHLLLKSCEASLERRNADIDRMKAIQDKLVEALRDVMTEISPAFNFDLKNAPEPYRSAQQLLQSIEQ